MGKERQVVYKNDGTIPVDEIRCTTYQMRNFYQQFRDGFFSDLDVMNYIQHLAAARMARAGWRVLDACCGRGLMLPLLRYHCKDIAEYIGIDIEEKNMTWLQKTPAGNKEYPNGREEYYPFRTTPIVGNVAAADQLVSGMVDMIVYTSSIEHMHKEDGEKSLTAMARLLKPGGLLFLSCPNTPEDQDGFDVRYQAHVYEWKLSELRQELTVRGFRITREIGLNGSLRDFYNIMEKMPRQLKVHYDLLREYVPNEFLKPLIFLHLPNLSSEVLILATR